MEETKKVGEKDPSENKKEKKTAIGLPENIEAVLCYLFAWVSGIILFVLEKKNDFIRFHALQSVFAFLLLNVLSFVLGFIPFLGWFVGGLLSLLGFVVWIILMVKAYQGERYKLPYIGDWVESVLKNRQ